MTLGLRTHRCGVMRKEHVGQPVVLKGWVANRRDHGGVIFVDLRDHTGIVQVVFKPEVKKFEELEHTADVGLRIFGASLPDLFANAAEGMFSLIGDASFPPHELRPLTFQIPAEEDTSDQAVVRGAPSSETLLCQWLQRLLREFNIRSFYPVKFQVEVGAAGCAAVVHGGIFDPSIHTFHTEIKGVTFHGLRVDKIGSGWQAEVIFDV